MFEKTAPEQRTTRQQQAAFPSLGQHGAAGQIIRQKEPENLEFPFATVDSFITPAPQFYVRSHFPTPKIDAKNWRLNIEGLVEHPTELSLDNLMDMPVHERIVTLECAGNGRIFLVPKENGAQWELGAVSNAKWTGVLLSDLLAQVGLNPGAVEIVFEGADEGQPDEKPKPPGKIHYARGIPLSKVDDVLLAYQMNGHPLTAAHGAPVRAIVGGWYGMASVKWLKRIVAIDKPFAGYFQSVDYAHWKDLDGMTTRVPLSEMKVKSQIARPTLHEIVPKDAEYRVVGAAWAGETQVEKVEVSTDGSKSYSSATLLGEPIRHAWRFWEFIWKTPSTPGTHTLMARATDSRGIQQATEHDINYGSYVIDHIIPIDVEVK